MNTPTLHRTAAALDKDQLAAQLAEAVETSNRYFDDRDWRMSEWWGLRAEELHAKLHLGTEAVR
jgi:hypothetical protein